MSVGLLLVGLVAGYFIGKGDTNPVVYQTATPTIITTEAPTMSIYLKNYTSKNLNISFKYPSDWTIKEGNDYPGSAQGQDYIKLTKGADLIYAGTKSDCLANYTYCKSVNGDWPSFSTQSTNPEISLVIDTIIATAVQLI